MSKNMVRVSVKETESGKLVEVIGDPMSEWKAGKVERGLLMRIDTEKFYVDTEEVDEKGNVVDGD